VQRCPLFPLSRARILLASSPLSMRAPCASCLCRPPWTSKPTRQLPLRVQWPWRRHPWTLHSSSSATRRWRRDKTHMCANDGRLLEVECTLDCLCECTELSWIPQVVPVGRQPFYCIGNFTNTKRARILGRLLAMEAAWVLDLKLLALRDDIGAHYVHRRADQTSHRPRRCLVRPSWAA
jgi:hypothetical protein